MSNCGYHVGRKLEPMCLDCLNQTFADGRADLQSKLDAALLQLRERDALYESQAAQSRKDYSILSGLKDQAVKELEESNRLIESLQNHGGHCAKGDGCSKRPRICGCGCNECWTARQKEKQTEKRVQPVPNGERLECGLEYRTGINLDLHHCTRIRGHGGECGRHTITHFDE